MAFYFSRISRWLWGSKEESVSNSSTPSTTYSDWGLSSETVRFPLAKGTKMATSPRKVKRKWQSRQERRIDREYDVVLVPTDGSEFLSGSESDDSDWSVGWTEPHAPDFVTDDDESDNSFAVLVACYKRPGCKKVEATNNELLSAIKILPNDFSSAGKNNMEEWLAYLRKFEA